MKNYLVTIKIGKVITNKLVKAETAEEAESVFETIGELTEYKFTGAKKVEGLTNDLYSKTIGLLNFIKVFSDEYTARKDGRE